MIYSSLSSAMLLFYILFIPFFLYVILFLQFFLQIFFTNQKDALLKKASSSVISSYLFLFYSLSFLFSFFFIFSYLTFLSYSFLSFLIPFFLLFLFQISRWRIYLKSVTTHFVKATQSF